MFDYTCTACDQRRLVFPGQLSRLVNDDDGIVVEFTCWCGSPQSVRTGSGRTIRPATPVGTARAW